MSGDAPDLRLVDEPAAGRFAARVGEDTAFVQYRRQGDVVVLVHTEVPPGLAGRGIGGALARATLDHVAAAGETVVPLCPFIARYIAEHPEYAGLVHKAAPGR